MIQVGHKVFFLREVGIEFGHAGWLGFGVLSCTDLIVMFFADPLVYEVASLD